MKKLARERAKPIIIRIRMTMLTGMKGLNFGHLERAKSASAVALSACAFSLSIPLLLRTLRRLRRAGMGSRTSALEPGVVILGFMATLRLLFNLWAGRFPQQVTSGDISLWNEVAIVQTGNSKAWFKRFNSVFGNIGSPNGNPRVRPAWLAM